MDKKFNSRKLWAFLVWALLVAAKIIFKVEIEKEIIYVFGGVTGIYILGQAAVDFITKYIEGKVNAAKSVTSDEK